ncbi:MAG: hypothetical protein IT383_22040 [Deltaproteobacteria bacterium]|nr:hypothetical protein [Deltaproteobacteria bacterium]
MKIAGLLGGVALVLMGCGISDDAREPCPLDEIEASGTPLDTDRQPSVSCGELVETQVFHSEQALADAGCTATESIDFEQSALVVGTISTTTQIRSVTLDANRVVIGLSLVGGCSGVPPGSADFALVVPTEVNEVTDVLCNDGAAPCNCGGLFNPCPP